MMSVPNDFIDISNDDVGGQAARSDSSTSAGQNGGPSTTPKQSEIETIRSELNTITIERNELSARLAAIYRREIETSLSAAAQVDSGQEHSVLAQLQDALDRAKALYEENTSLRSQLAVAQVQTTEKKRLELELMRLKEHWKSLNQLGQIGFANPSPQPREPPQSAFTPSSSLVESLRQETAANRGLREENARLKMEVDRLAKHIESINQQVASDSVRLGSEIERLKRENGQLAALGPQYNQLAVEHERLKTEYGPNAQRNLQEIMRLQNEKRQLSCDVNQLASERNSLHEANRQLHQDSQQLRLELSRWSEGYHQVNLVKDELAKCQAELCQLKQENQHLTAEFNSLTSRHKALEGENQLVSADNYVQKMKLLAAEQNRQVLVSGLKKLASEAAQLKEELIDVKKQFEGGILAASSNHRSSQWEAEIAVILSEFQSGNSKSIQGAESQTEPYPPAKFREKMIQLAKNRDEWKRKHETLLKKILEVKKFSTSQDLEMDESGAIAIKPSAAASTEKDIRDSEPLSTDRSTALAKQQRLIHDTALELERLKSIFRAKLKGAREVNEVFKAADFVWGSIRTIISEVVKKNSRMEAELPVLKSCLNRAQVVAISKKEKVEIITEKKEAEGDNAVQQGMETEATQEAKPEEATPNERMEVTEQNA